MMFYPVQNSIFGDYSLNQWSIRWTVSKFDTALFTLPDTETDKTNGCIEYVEVIILQRDRHHRFLGVRQCKPVHTFQNGILLLKLEWKPHPTLVITAIRSVSQT